MAMVVHIGADTANIPLYLFFLFFCLFRFGFELDMYPAEISVAPQELFCTDPQEVVSRKKRLYLSLT